MSGKRQKRLDHAVRKVAQGPGKSNRARRVLLLGTPVVLVAAIAAAHFAFFRDKPANPALAGTSIPVKFVRSARTLDGLLDLPAENLGNVDIAEMNLLCAAGLPGAEGLDIDQALATLDQWAARVASETNRHLYRVTDPRYADHYRHSEAYLRAEMLVQALCEDLGVKYNLAAKDDFKFNDSRVAFIHAMIPMPGQAVADTQGGTCASMPVLYVAVGRRLGYPLKLATTKAHIFVRWDGQDHPNPAWRDRFNIEGTNGFSSYPDDYYKTWPFKLTDQEVSANCYLVSLTPMEEFAGFLAARGHCGLDNGQPAFAARCYEDAYSYDSRRPAHAAWFVDAALRCGYRPITPVLAALLAQRRLPVAAAAARRPAMAAAADFDLPALPPTRIDPWDPQPQVPGVQQPPRPFGPRQPQSGAPRLGAPNPYQPYQPPR
jgi:hypothetical protein